MVVVYEPGFPTHGKFVVVTTGGIKVAMQLAKECGVGACELVQPTKAYLWNSGTLSNHSLLFIIIDFLFISSFFKMSSFDFCVDGAEESFTNLVEIVKLYNMYVDRVEVPLGELLASIAHIP